MLRGLFKLCLDVEQADREGRRKGQEGEPGVGKSPKALPLPNDERIIDGEYTVKGTRREGE